MYQHDQSAVRSASRTLVNSAALLILGAAAIHFAVVPEHLQEYLPFGVFFIVAGALQTVLAAAILAWPSRRLFLAALGVSAGLVALWLLSRTAGLPIGPHPGQPEDVGIPDLMCIALEALAVLVLLVLAVRTPHLRKPRPVRSALGTAPVVLAVGLLTFVGVGAAADAMPVAFNAAPPVPGQRSISVTDLTDAGTAGPVKQFTLTAAVKRIDGRQAWTYNGTVPGPMLRVTQGDRVKVTLINHLPEATTIHWHGVRVPNAMDGVAGVTQNAVPSGGRYTYDFVARDAGTYWYHSHQDTGNQLPRGLFGALIVEPRPGHVPEQRDYTVVLHTPPLANGVAVNGALGDLRLAARPGEQVRLRLINAVAPSMDGGPEAPVLLGAPYRVVSLDGHDLNQPQVLGPERLPLGVGQRADLVFTMPATGAVRLIVTAGHGASSALQQFFSGPPGPLGTVTIGEGALPPARTVDHLPVFDLTRYGVPTADPLARGPFAATYPVVLGEGPGFHDGHIQLVHTINGQASPYIPPLTVHEGEVVRLHIVNETGEYHPMHLHGHVFSVLARNGRPLQGSPVHLDSILVGPHESWDVAFRADNPGIWMFHCHVLLHASFGMSMTVNYVGVSTPYEMGSRSGNVPE
jgi:FtsP/CotA-like multicopper oxidase with cupredoxin domain